jgi:hypothetical protein
VAVGWCSTNTWASCDRLSCAKVRRTRYRGADVLFTDVDFGELFLIQEISRWLLCGNKQYFVFLIILCAFLTDASGLIAISIIFIAI